MESAQDVRWWDNWRKTWSTKLGLKKKETNE